jgi:hypothetical protein
MTHPPMSPLLLLAYLHMLARVEWLLMLLREGCKVAWGGVGWGGVGE